MTKTIRRVYMTVEIPSDCETDPERRFELAILEARERMRHYVMPCQWRKVWDNGQKVRLVRESHLVQRR